MLAFSWYILHERATQFRTVTVPRRERIRLEFVTPRPGGLNGDKHPGEGGQREQEQQQGGRIAGLVDAEGSIEPALVRQPSEEREIRRAT